MAGLIEALSKNSSLPFTPEELRMLAKQHPDREGKGREVPYKAHGIVARLGQEKVAEVLNRYVASESATALAKEYEVAPSALIRLLRENNVVVRRKTLTPELKALLVKEYEDGATVAELEARHQLSHGSVLRALHGAGVVMRAKAPRARTVPA